MTLNNKSYICEGNHRPVIDKRDVREFIRNIKIAFCQCDKHIEHYCDFCAVIDEQAGRELIEESEVPDEDKR